ncbi:MAG TPA: hypothetical protein VGI57_03815, partial [Usitatibacter sp.]
MFLHPRDLALEARDERAHVASHQTLGRVPKGFWLRRIGLPRSPATATATAATTTTTATSAMPAPASVTQQAKYGVDRQREHFRNTQFPETGRDGMRVACTRDLRGHHDCQHPHHHQDAGPRSGDIDGNAEGTDGEVLPGVDAGLIAKQ